LFARLAAFRLVLKTFIVEKNLLAYGPNELLTAVYALNRPILKVRRLVTLGRERFAL